MKVEDYGISHEKMKYRWQSNITYGEVPAVQLVLA